MKAHVIRILTAALAAFALSCGSSGDKHTSQEMPARARVDSNGTPLGGKVVIGVQHEPEMLSEILHATATNNMVCNLIFSKFVKYDDRFQLIPDLIEEIPTLDNGGISADRLRYTYRLRGDARWHDGVPVTSTDVRFTYDVIMDPEVNVESREGWDVVERVETPDQWTVIFHLKRPYIDFVSETFYDESVLPEHVLRNVTGSRFHSARFHHAPVGSGPFRFREWAPGSHLVLEANHDYYAEGPYLDEIIFKFIPNENTLLVQLMTGEIDIFDNANIGFIDQLTNIPGVRVYRTPMVMYEHLDLNTEHPILADRRVRQALSLATNKAEIAEKIYNGLVQVADLDEFEQSKYYNAAAAARVVYDPRRAESLLAEAGWTDSNGDGFLDRDGVPLRLSITAASGQVNRERTELVLRDQYRKIGVDLVIRNYNPTVLYGTFEDGGILKRGKYDIAMYAWLSSPEPATKEALYSSKNIPPLGQNHPRIDHTELTQLLAMGSNEVDPDARISIYHRIAEILVDEMPVIPLFWYTSIDPCTERLRNYRPNPTQSADTWNAALWYLADTEDLSRR
ncbi:MAG: peptide ABC transporter substrate-binding protein [Candidatus Krumholzibacteriota bacterium]|nr:peptide ABC transporter substrate-binding protein [Candidatus Krumholzibacteriota bacterium]